MTTIYLIRHAEAEGNYYRRIQGHYNSRVTAFGKKQIELLAERFRGTPIDAVYSSDLTRTQETAGAILKYHPELELKPLPGLREIGMGQWEDLPWGNALYSYPEQIINFATRPKQWSIPNCESFLHLQARIYDTIESLARAHDGKTIAIASHGTAIRTFLCRVLGVPLERITEVAHGDNTAVARLSYDGGAFTAAYYNDNSHLSDEFSTFARQAWWREEKHFSPDLASLRLVPLSLAENTKLYLDSYADSWQNAHGCLEGFRAKDCLEGAEAASRADPNCLMQACSIKGDFAGLIQLHPTYGAHEGAGWLSLIYLIPERRDKNFGVQLLGHAVSYFRAKGRRSIRLHASESNPRAISFYEREDFRRIGTEPGALGDLALMEMEI
ncbi:MAG: GNAT family N-acetyltransferase [Oscillospiraceae bacterium]|jgi:probable phosphoglycerate mutase|nr:GNAT family N-acetyltransferase [Oscillospiraceae bacterium]